MISEKQIESRIEALFKGLAFPERPENVYAPQRYMIEIGGKRIRPRLCLTAYAALGGELLDEAVLAPAAGLELFHTFSLIHDDIMDNSPLRRGQETVWKKWGNDIALLSGDAMLIESYKYMLKAPEKVRSQVLQLFSENATKVIILGWPETFIEHGSQKKLQAQYGLDAEGSADSIRKGLSS